MNLLTINTCALIKLINQYEPNIDEHFQVNPILLMNEDTINILKRQTSEILLLNTDKKCYKMFNGCYIAIANWLPLDEVLLK